MIKPIYFSPGQTPRTSPALLLENRRQLDLGQMEVKTIRLLSAKVPTFKHQFKYDSVFFCERGDTPISFGAKGESLQHYSKEPGAADRSTPSELGPSIKDFEQGRAASKNQIKTKYGVEGIGDRLLKRHARNKPPPQHAPGHAAQLVGPVCSAINPRSLLPALPRNKSI